MYLSCDQVLMQEQVSPALKSPPAGLIRSDSRGHVLPHLGGTVDSYKLITDTPVWVMSLGLWPAFPLGLVDGDLTEGFLSGPSGIRLMGGIFLEACLIKTT